MEKSAIIDLLFTMCDATSAAVKGASFDEVISFVKRQHKNLDPSILEAFRDALGPLYKYVAPVDAQSLSGSSSEDSNSNNV